MRKMENAFRRHDPYLAALDRIIRYLEIVSGLQADELPRRDETIKYLETALVHLVNRSDCVACSASRGLQDAELAFLAAYGRFSEHPEYRRWLKGQHVNICYSDGKDTETVDDPLNCIAVFINRKRLDTVGNSVHTTAQEMLSEISRRL